MSINDDLDRLKEQERKLVFTSFNEAEAFSLGARLCELARDRGLAIIAQIDFWDRPLFYAALPGSTASNRDWARRKINSVRLYHKSSYRMFIEQGAKQRIFAADFGLDPRDYAIAGGAFPIRVEGFGAVGAVAVSGLPQREDHALVVEALSLHLGLAPEAMALPAENA